VIVIAQQVTLLPKKEESNWQ